MHMRTDIDVHIIVAVNILRWYCLTSCRRLSQCLLAIVIYIYIYIYIYICIFNNLYIHVTMQTNSWLMITSHNNMMTSSYGNIFRFTYPLCYWNSPVTGEFPTQRSVTRSFDIFYDLLLNKRLSKQSWGWWFETPSRLLWRHCNEPAHTKKHVYLATMYILNAILVIIQQTSQLFTTYQLPKHN